MVASTDGPTSVWPPPSTLLVGPGGSVDEVCGDYSAAGDAEKDKPSSATGGFANCYALTRVSSVPFLLVLVAGGDVNSTCLDTAAAWGTTGGH